MLFLPVSCGNEPVQLAAGQGGHFGRQGLAGGDAVQRAVHVVAELRPMGGAGDQHGVFAAQVLGRLVRHGRMRVHQVVVLFQHGA